MKTQLNCALSDGLTKHLRSGLRLTRQLTFAILAFAAIFVQPARSQSNGVAIPFDRIGAVAGKQYSGDALTVSSIPEGARLRCAFQRLNARVTAEGLWLASTVDGAQGEPFRIVARAMGRGRAEALPDMGEINVTDQTVCFIRPRLTEEYTVSVDGVRQDFVIGQRPMGTGPVTVELAVDGAKAEAITDGARLRLADGGRKLVYARLKAQDAKGRQLKARMEVVSAKRLLVVLDDTGAEYPVRIDPTFSDANWVSLGGLQGVDDGVRAAVVDSAGNLYIGGTFHAAGSVLANGVAKWNGVSWSALGSGMSHQFGAVVQALAVSGNTLYAGGYFDTAGGVAATNIAQWNGISWSAVGSGINGGIRALALSGNTLYAGGNFTVIDSVPANGIAQWNGSSWSAVGSGVTGGYGEVTALAVSSNALYVGGFFTSAGAVAATNIARWDGSSWAALGPGLSGGNNEVAALLVAGDMLYAGGQFAMAGAVPANCIAQWNGTSWSALGSGITGNSYPKVGALAMWGTNLYALGYFDTAGGVPASFIAQWNGSSWSALGSGLKLGSQYNSGVSALVVLSNSLYVGGQFVQAGGVPANNVALWNGSSWSALGSPAFAPSAYGEITSVATWGDTLYAAGSFTNACGTPANNIAQWNGSSWSALGSGISGVGSAGYGPYVRTVAASSNALYVGGSFGAAGGIPATNIAQWDGTSWSALGLGMNGTVVALAVSSNTVYAGGSFTTAGGTAANYIARWDGTFWTAMGTGMNATVRSLVVSSNMVYVGGDFTTAGGVSANNVSQWDGSSWSPLGSGMNGTVQALAVSGNTLYAAGGFNVAGGTPANYIAQWNGSSWSSLGSGLMIEQFFPWDVPNVNALAASGDSLYAAGYFTQAGGIPVNNIARWNGTSWSALGLGISGEDGDYLEADVSSLAISAAGNLYVGGGFSVAGTNGSALVAEFLLSQFSHDLTLTRLGDGTNLITGLGTPGYSYALDLATNLAPPINWMPQATNTQPGMNLIFTNVNSFPQGIYRTRCVPQ